MEQKLIKQTQKNLTWYARVCYGAGHFLNDLCASMWFTYLLVYFHLVINFSSEMAGYLILIGQLVDAVMTPLIGLEIDRCKKGLFGLDKRKCWHFLGTMFVLLSFTFLFNLCIGCSICDRDSKSTMLSSNCNFQFAYYVPFIIFFQIGWAITQISHLSLIPVLTPHAGERLELVSIRNGFQVIAGIVVYSTAWVLLNLHTAEENDVGNTTKSQINFTNISDINDLSSITSEDLSVFSKLVLIIVGIGLGFQVLFYCGTPAKNVSTIATEESQRDMKRYDISRANTGDHNYNKMTWKDWLKEIQFYEIGLLYMCSRMVVNLSQTYLPLFLAQDLKLPKIYIAIIPLIIFTSGFMMSLIQRPLNQCCGTKVKYLIGSIMALSSCVWMWFLQINDKPEEIFYIAVLLGLGNAVLLIYSLSMVSDLIGSNTGSGAFVYGVMSFFDKISNGVTIAIIQNFHPNELEQTSSQNDNGFYRKIMVFVPGCLTVISLFTLFIISRSTLGELRKFTKYSGPTEPGHCCDKICWKRKCKICLFFSAPQTDSEETKPIRFNSSFPDFQTMSIRTRGSI